LEPAAGKANWSIFAMAREGLRDELTTAFRKAVRRKETVGLKNIAIRTNGETHVVDVSIEPLSEPQALRGRVMIVFTDVAAMPDVVASGHQRGDTARVAALRHEVEHARHELQSAREEMQTSQEELQSANEELQSTNEQLTTSEEELQSMNEELQTVNQELQTRLDEFTRVNNDIKNLLDSTDIATIFLDNDLCVRRFTSETSKIIHLIRSDVGRPVTDIASALVYHELTDDARQVLRTLVPVERQIPTPDGNWYAVRILPYRTLTNVIDGLVITFIDITASKKVEEELRATEARLRELLDQKS
jgi:two-component system CheB/CheR fusion protein